MDRRLEEFRSLVSKVPIENETVRKEAERIVQIMQEGLSGEFWLHLKSRIDSLIFEAERRFVDVLAPNYEVYVQWWSRRQALIAVVALPQATEPKRRTDATG